MYQEQTFESINFIGAQVVIYAGITILIFGMFGSISNIIVFRTLKTFRDSSCAFFLTVMSFFNIGQLSVSLIIRILLSGFCLNYLEMSVFFCKFRNYVLQVCGLISYTCMCLATTDQFLATSLRRQWQEAFNIKRARYLCVFSIIIWLLHGIPVFIWYSPRYSTLTNKTSCIILNSAYQQYISYVYLIVLAGIAPIFITILFGSLAYWNVRQIPYRVVPLVRRELDKQLGNMVLVQVVLNIFYMLPCVIVLLLMYTLHPTIVSNYSAYFTLAYNMAALMYYLYFSVSRSIKVQLVLFSNLFLDSILHLYYCIETFPSTIPSCTNKYFSSLLESTNHCK